jgi:TonB family protein
MLHRLHYLLLLLVGCCSLLAAGTDSSGLTEIPGEPVIDLIVEDTSGGKGASGTQTTSPAADSEQVPEVMPVLTGFVEAEYPASLVKKGVTGTVMLELLVSETGSVDSVTVLKGIVPELDSSATAAARKFRFSPAKSDTTPVAVLLQYAYTFSLDNAVDSIHSFVNFFGACIEKGTKKPIPDAMISITFIDTTSDTALPVPFSTYLKKICTSDSQQLDNGHIITNSDEFGNFAFRSLPACSILVNVIIPGYETFKTHERISRTEELSVKYFIERRSYSEYEVVVYGKSEEKEVSRRQLSVNEVRKVPGFGGDVIKAIQAFPGVSRQMVGSGEIIVRGAPTGDSRFFLDGMEIPVLYHFGALKSTYNSDGLSSIDFYPGGFGTRYGGAIAGIIEIKGRKGTNERLKGSAELSTLDGSFFIEGPVFDSVTVIANVRRSFIGDVLNQIFKAAPDQFPFTMYPYYWDYLFRTDMATKKLGNFYLSLFGSRDSMIFIFPEMRFGSDEIDEQTDRMGSNTTFHTGVIGWDWDIDKRWTNSFRYNLMSIYSAFSSGFFKEKDDIIVNHLRDQLTYNVNSHLKINAGADMQWSVLDLKLKVAVASGEVLPITRNNWHFGDVAGYINLEWKPIEQLLLIPGLRYDYYPELLYDGSIVPEFWDYTKYDDYHGPSGEPSFRLNGKYTFIKNHAAKFAIGTYNQTPEPMGQALMKEFGDPFMPATKAAQYVTGYEWQITDLIDLDAQCYYNNQWNIPEWSTDDDISDNGENQNVMTHDGLGRMYGVELMVRHQQGNRFFGWLAYSLSRSERCTIHKKKWKVYSEDETHYLQLVGSWKFPKNWEAGFHIKFASGKPTTKIYGIAEEDENATPGAYGIIAKTGRTNADRMDPAFQLDLRLDKKIIADKSILSFFVDLQNIGWFVYKSTDQYLYGAFYDEKEPFSMFPLFAIGVRYDY